MMSDFEIDVGFNTEQLKGAMSGSAGGSTGGAGGSAGIAKGFSTALKGLGIVAILSQLKVVMDSVKFVLGIISSLIGFIVVKFVQGLFKFFDDPVRGLLGLGLFIINGVIGGLDLVIAAINMLIPGTSHDISMVPKLNIDEILKAYDAAVAASKAASEGIVDSANTFDLTVGTGIDIVKKAALDSLEKQAKLYETINRKAESLISELGGGSSRSIHRSSGSSGSTFDNLQNYSGRMSRDPIVEQKRRDANAILKFLN